MLGVEVLKLSAATAFATCHAGCTIAVEHATGQGSVRYIEGQGPAPGNASLEEGPLLLIPWCRYPGQAGSSEEEVTSVSRRGTLTGDTRFINRQPTARTYGFPSCSLHFHARSWLIAVRWSY